MHTKEQWNWSPDEEIDNGYLFAEWLQQDNVGLIRPERGDILQGIIVQISPTEILVDVGAKRDGFVPASDLERLPAQMRESLEEGQQVAVIVTRVYEDTGDIELSIAQALQQQDWLRAKELLESKEVVEVEVTGYNRGGLTVRFGQIRGFVPLSHVAEMPRNIPPEERQKRMAAMVGQHIPVCAIEVDRSRRRLIFSNREGVERLREQRKEELLATLQEGQVISGRVRSFADFGVFVDLGGVDGLIHRSELSWEHVENPRDILEPGQEIEVKVIKVDKEKRRIGLSLKRLQPNPWEERIARYSVGDIVTVTITNVTDFGAFARLEAGLEGLIHISELGLASGQKPEDLVQPGDEVNVQILDIDHERQRISLSMRRAPQWEVAEEPSEEAGAEEEQEPAAPEEEPAEKVSMDESSNGSPTKSAETEMPSRATDQPVVPADSEHGNESEHQEAAMSGGG